MKYRLTLRQAGARLIIILALTSFYLLYAVKIIGYDGIITAPRAFTAGIPLIIAILLTLRVIVGLVIQAFYKVGTLVKTSLDNAEKLTQPPILEEQN